MTALFPTYTNLWNRAKRFLETDLTPLWERFLDVCDSDSESYQKDLEARGVGDLDLFGFGKFI